MLFKIVAKMFALNKHFFVLLTQLEWMKVNVRNVRTLEIVNVKELFNHQRNLRMIAK